MFVVKLKEMHRPYLLFAALRIILTCLPQIGYVHPDEFFQSVEVILGKLFSVEAKIPWEFNVTFPIRSVTPSYLTVGTSYQILKTLNLFLSQQFGINLITPYFVVIFPRLLICCLSFLTDWSLYKICLVNNEKCNSRCFILSVSYVMLIYATRTFSNTIELILFSLLLYYVAESVIFSTINVRQREYLNNRYNAAETAVEKAKFHKLRLFLEDDSLRNCFIIATITTAGVFNRPTFVTYAIAPVFFWLYRSIGFKSIRSLHFHLRIFVFLLSTIPTIFLFIVVDSFYFGYLTWAEIGMLKISINNFVVTPLNFIKYNIDSTNLAKHGLHPWYLHAVVNIPLLFNVLGILGYCNIMDLFSNLIQAKYHYLPTVRSIRGLMTVSFIIPLAMLSIFPHQEPRFLIPLILPLVYLYGSKVFPESDDVIVKSFTSFGQRSTRKRTGKSSTLFKIWVVINVLLTIFYGFIHQGGVVPFLSYLHNNMQQSHNEVQYHVVTSHTYIMPESLLLRPSKYYDPYGKYKRLKQLMWYEEGSKNLKTVLTTVTTLLNICKSKTFHRFRCRVYLVIPTSLTDNLLYHLYKHDTNLLLNNTVTFYPHLSVEALPDVLCLEHDDCKNVLLHPFSTAVTFLHSFGLACIEFVLNDRHN